MKRFSLLVPVVIVAAAAVLPALAAPSGNTASIVIRHQLRGCHTWSLNGGAYKVDLAVRLARRGSLTITNNDPMVHQLVQQSGRRVAMRTIAHEHMKKMVGHHRITGRGVMNHMSAALRVTFPEAGVYRFTTKDLGDYFDLKSVGHHHHLMLTVRIS